MKKLTLMLFATIGLASVSQGRVLSVEVDKERMNENRNVYIASIEACPGTFQSVITKVRKVEADAAVVDLTPALDVSVCGPKVTYARYFILIDPELKELGLDPKTSRVYFELQ